jgi:hypothetical protein
MNKTAAIAIGLVVVVVLGVLIFLSLPHPKDKETSLALGEASPGNCNTTTADKNVEGVERGALVRWTITNSCGAAQLVTLGNFRKVEATSKTNCNDATEGGADWPFKKGDEDINKRQVTVPPNPSVTGHIQLHDAQNPSTTEKNRYYFSICLGSTVKDPRLVIEP